MRWSVKAFTLLELMAIIVVVVVAAMMLPTIVRRLAPKAARINCVYNLKNVGLALRIFATDNKNRFPFEISTNDGGTLELRSSLNAQFQVLSNELSSPKTLICPIRVPPMAFANDFAHLANTNIGYFLNVSAKESDTNRILAGDTGFTLDNVLSINQSKNLTNPSIRYPANLHEAKLPPTYLLTDGSAYYFRNLPRDNAPTADFKAPDEILIP